MYKEEFENYMTKVENKKLTTVALYVSAIKKISKNYSETIGEDIDIYQIDDLYDLKNIEDEYEMSDAYDEFGAMANACKSALLTYIRFIENKNGITDSNKNTKRVDEENIITKALLSQIEELFPGYTKSDELGFGEKRIDLLLKNNNNLKAIKVITGNADKKYLDPLSDYMEQDKFDEKTITGIIIADSIDDSLRRAMKNTINIELWVYNIKFMLNKNE